MIKLHYTSANLLKESSNLIAGIPGYQLVQASMSELNNSSLPALVLSSDGLWFMSQHFKPLNLTEFYSNFILMRAKSVQRETLIQAANIKVNQENQIKALDLTAGLGRDSILMSLYGYQVTMVESNPYLAVILKFLTTTFSNRLPLLQLVYMDNLNFLKANLDRYDIVYLDPMFQDGKQALAKKDMQIIDQCQLMISEQQEPRSNDELFAQAKKSCSNKLIIKRDNKQACLVASPKPTYSKLGKTIRFDIYQC